MHAALSAVCECAAAHSSVLRCASLSSPFSADTHRTRISMQLVLFIKLYHLIFLSYMQSVASNAVKQALSAQLFT